MTVPPVTVENNLGCLLVEVNRSWDKLQTTTQKLSDSKKYSYLSHHYKPSANDALQSHPVTKSGKTWNVTFQLRWLEEFPWLSYSSVVAGGICRNCILFPEQPGKGEGPGNNSRRLALLVLCSYQKPYSKAFCKTGVLVRHGNTLMHQRYTERADFFLRNYHHSNERIDSRLLHQSNQLAEENKHVLSQIVLAIEFRSREDIFITSSSQDLHKIKTQRGALF